jgi:hypothetical protein
MISTPNTHGRLSMLAKRIIFIVLAISPFVLSSCGSKSNEPMSNEQAIDIAAHHLIGKSFDVTPPSTVTFADEKYTVIFTRPVPGDNSGETYTSKVIFDAKTKEALEIEVNADTSGKSISTRPQPEYRPTPLGEEVDQVEALRKKMNIPSR